MSLLWLERNVGSLTVTQILAGLVFKFNPVRLVVRSNSFGIDLGVLEFLSEMRVQETVIQPHRLIGWAARRVRPPSEAGLIP